MSKIGNSQTFNLFEIMGLVPTLSQGVIEKKGNIKITFPQGEYRLDSNQAKELLNQIYTASPLVKMNFKSGKELSIEQAISSMGKDFLFDQMHFEELTNNKIKRNMDIKMIAKLLADSNIRVDHKNIANHLKKRYSAAHVTEKFIK